MNKKYRWNKRKFAKSVGTFLAMVVIATAFDLAVFVAFFGEYLGF